MLADAGTPKAFDALLDIAGKARGQTRVQRARACSRRRTRAIRRSASCSPTRCSPAAARRRSYAAGVLGRIGTEDARQALVTALTGKDKDLAAAAAGALGQIGMTDTVKAALLSAAQRQPAGQDAGDARSCVQSGAPEGLRLAEEMLERQGPAGAARTAVWALAQNGTDRGRAACSSARSTRRTRACAARGDLVARAEPRRALDRHAAAARRATATRRCARRRCRRSARSARDRAQQAIIDATRSGKTEDRDRRDLRPRRAWTTRARASSSRS